MALVRACGGQYSDAKLTPRSADAHLGNGNALREGLVGHRANAPTHTHLASASYQGANETATPFVRLNPVPNGPAESR